jgi:hypothetical protein
MTDGSTNCAVAGRRSDSINVPPKSSSSDSDRLCIDVHVHLSHELREINDDPAFTRRCSRRIMSSTWMSVLYNVISVLYNVISEGLTFNSEIDAVADCVLDYFAHILVRLDKDHCSSFLLRQSGPSFQAFVIGRVGGDDDIPFDDVLGGVERVGMYKCHVC